MATRKAKTATPANFGKRMREATLQAWTAIVLALIGAGLLIAGMVIPPPGELHPSVIQGFGLLTVMVAIFFAWDATVRGLNAKFEHGKTKVSVGGKSRRKSTQSDPPPNDDE